MNTFKPNYLTPLHFKGLTDFLKLTAEAQHLFTEEQDQAQDNEIQDQDQCCLN